MALRSPGRKSAAFPDRPQATFDARPRGSCDEAEGPLVERPRMPFPGRSLYWSPCLGLVVAFLLGIPVPSLATPTHYTIDQGTFSADVSGDVMVDISTSLGDTTLDIPFSQPVQATFTGSIDLDWGDPVTPSDPGRWLGEMIVDTQGLSVTATTPNKSVGYTTRSIDLFGFTTLTFSAGLESLELDMTGPATFIGGDEEGFRSLTTPSGLDASSWTSQDPIDVAGLLSATVSFTGALGNTISIPLAYPIPGPPNLQISLGRSSGGSFVGLPDGGVASASFSATAGGGSDCVKGLLGNCIFSWSYTASVMAHVTNASWTGLHGSSPATIPLPEPSEALLGAVALAALSVRRSRER